MAKITQYVAPHKVPAESTRGVSAWEQAGRRLGPLYNEAASFEKEIGKNDIEAGKYAAEGIKEKAWPFDIGELYDKQAKAGGFNVKVSGGSDSWNALLNGGRTPVYGDEAQDAVKQISNGAAALGKSLSDGGYAVATRAPAAPLQTLVMGSLVNVSDAAKTAAQINRETAANNAATLDPLVNMENYWTKMQGGNPYATDQSQISMTPSAADKSQIVNSAYGVDNSGVDVNGNPAGANYSYPDPSLNPLGPSGAGYYSDSGNSWSSLIPSATDATGGNAVSDNAAASTPAPDTGGM